ncbi:MAG: hypothetical protein J1F11_03350 [Oscillospiraceae bacterium]|nr:hypothetical protein [Oscillospiraceae bacterium]
MKKIMLIIISVVMLFAACKNSTENITNTTAESYIETSAPTQINPAEEFNGITLGMTKDEIINTLGKQPDRVTNSNIKYNNESYFNIENAEVSYFINDVYGLIFVSATYHYPTGSEQKMIDYTSIKEELFKRYPQETFTEFSEEDNNLKFNTENRYVSLSAADEDSLYVIIGIDDMEKLQKKSNNNAETPSETQIDPAEEFDGITFGMSKEDVIKTLSKDPDYETEETLEYSNEIFFGLSNASIMYDFDDNALNLIFVSYSYRSESEKEQIPADYAYLKEELLKRYPESAFTYFSEQNDRFSFFTENRNAMLTMSDYSIIFTIGKLDMDE